MSKKNKALRIKVVCEGLNLLLEKLRTYRHQLLYCSSRLPDTVYETTCMALSEGTGNLLAVGWRVLEEGIMTIMDLKTGDRIHTIQSHHFLSSIQVGDHWLELLN